MSLARARRQRRAMNDHERLLRVLLRARRFGDFKFRRQVPLVGHVVDFCCFERKLVVELDGSQHAHAENAALDAQRSLILGQAGFHVVRIWVSDLYGDREGVLEAIWQGLHR